jgi:hypothetical protein
MGINKRENIVRRQTALYTASGIVIFYPGRLMAGQIHQWAERYGGCRTAVSFERTLPGIRRHLRRAELAVINATDDPAQASDAFLQSVGMLGAQSVAVYTEKTHDGLELLVRTQGAPFLLGPMSMTEWEDFLESKFPMLIPLDSGADRGYHADLSPTGENENSEEEIIIYYKPIAG